MSILDLGDPNHARADQKLRSEVVMWLTTVTLDGQPQSTPVWFGWDGETVLLYSQPDRPKLANIASNPKVALHLVGDDEAEDVVTFEGTAAVDPTAPPADQVEGYIHKYLELIESNGWTPASLAAGYSVAVRVTPTRVRVVL